MCVTLAQEARRRTWRCAISARSAVLAAQVRSRSWCSSGRAALRAQVHALQAVHRQVALQLEGLGEPLPAVVAIARQVLAI